MRTFLQKQLACHPGLLTLALKTQHFGRKHQVSARSPRFNLTVSGFSYGTEIPFLASCQELIEMNCCNRCDLLLRTRQNRLFWVKQNLSRARWYRKPKRGFFSICKHSP